MKLMPNLSRRSIDIELMDIPDSDPQQLAQSLRQLATINRLLTPCHRLIDKHFLATLGGASKRQWSLLDIGAGGGDFAMGISRQCKRLGVELQITCLDHDPRVVEFARNNCREFENIEIVQSDVLALGDSGRRWDFVFANHFLHHLSDDQLAAVLPIVRRVCRHSFILTDLWRSHFSYYSYSCLAAICFRNSFCFHDGRISIRKGFQRRELQRLVDASGLSADAIVAWHFPAHFSIIGHISG